jgi:N-acetylglucosamine-6-phosphate deacetylase
MEPVANPALNDAVFALAADRVFDGYRWHDNAAVLIERGLVRGIARPGDIPRDWEHRIVPAGMLLAPGFIDLQVNGGGGVLLNDHPTVEAMQAIAKAHRRYGTTSCLPTFITDTREKAEAAIAGACAAAGTAGILGLHLEGPFISPARAGIHPPERIAAAIPADLEWLGALASAGTSLVTLAPECVPSGFVRKLAASGIRVAAGHSEASAATMLDAMAEGLRGVTHLHNAMPPMLAREPGIVGTALSDPRLTVGLIVDGIHVDPAVVRATFAAKGFGGIALVTDAMPTVGTSDDGFQLLGRAIRLSNGKLTSQAGTLAGAHLDMATAVRTAVKRAGVPLDDALRSASLTPARFLGLEDQRGNLKNGARADIVALTSDLHVTSTWIGGEASGAEAELR